jgi:group I intron endonuclease
MGVYRIRNKVNGKSYVGFSTDLQAKLSRHKAELKFGTHRNAELLGEWKSFGESCFEFEILDELEYEENCKTNPAEELNLLTEIWMGKLAKEGSLVARLQ